MASAERFPPHPPAASATAPSLSHGGEREFSHRESFIVIHSLDHARAALMAARELGVPVVLCSAAGAAAYAGPGWFTALVGAVAAEFPEVALSSVLDCGAEPGLVLAALRHGVRRIRFTGSDAALQRLAEIAGQHGAIIESVMPAPILDLLDRRDATAACRAFLKRNSAAE